MKKLKLKALELGAKKTLTRAEMKKVSGGNEPDGCHYGTCGSYSCYTISGNSVSCNDCCIA
jgi:hypothetical protein